jgi:hypothetical protein
VELPGDAFTEVQLLQTGRVLVAPPRTVTPRLSAADAVAALRRDGIKPATTANDPSDVRLGLFTSTQMGERTPTGFVPSFQDRLSWIIRYYDVPREGPSGARPLQDRPDLASQLSDVLFVVDAETGELLVASSQSASLE